MVAVEMWEPAFGAGFQARWDGQQIFGQDAARGPTERHFHSEPGILPILMRILSLAAAQDQNVRFQKPAQNEHFYRLSCRARFVLAFRRQPWAAHLHMMLLLLSAKKGPQTDYWPNRFRLR